MKTQTNPVSLTSSSIVHPALVTVASLAAAALAGPVAGLALALVGVRLGVMFSATAEARATPRGALQTARA